MRGVIVLIAAASCATAGSETVDSGPDATVRRDSGLDAFVNACPSADTCAAATMLGTVSGDTNNQKLTAMGYRAAWYRVRVTENDNSVSGVKLRVAAKLTSPTAVDFDVVVYLNTTSDVVECAATFGTTTTNGLVDQVRAEWGEGGVANGNDDGRNVSIEVRPVSGQCVPAYPWQLEIEGHWN